MKILRDKTTVIAIAAAGALLFMGYTNWQQANANKMLSVQVDDLNTQLQQLNQKTSDLQERVDILAQRLEPKPQKLIASQ